MSGKEKKARRLLNNTILLRNWCEKKKKKNEDNDKRQKWNDVKEKKKKEERLERLERRPERKGFLADSYTLGKEMGFFSKINS